MYRKLKFKPQFFVLSVIGILLFSCNQLSKQSQLVNTDLLMPDTCKVEEVKIIDFSKCPPPREIKVPIKPTTIEQNGKSIKLSPPFIHQFIDSVTGNPLQIQSIGKGLFSNFDTEDGLALSGILCGYKDRAGNLWFGTNGAGVSKFDGNTFHNFNLAGLRNNSIISIFEDSRGYMWFGTYGNGVVCFDGYCFTSFFKEDGLPLNVVWSIFEDSKHNLWFGSGGSGVAKFILGLNQKISDGKFVYLPELAQLEKKGVKTITEDQNGNLWFSTNNTGICTFNGKELKFYSEKDGLCSNQIRKIYIDSKNNVWVGTTNNGVSKFDGKSFVNYSTKNGLPNNRVYSIIEDSEANIWFATNGGGVSKFDGHTFINLNTTNGSSDNDVVDVIKDNFGSLWFCTFGSGVCRYNGSSVVSLNVANGFPQGGIFGIDEDKNGTIWFATNGSGINCFDGKTLKTFKQEQGLLNNLTYGLTIDHNENIWFAGDVNGAIKYIPPTNKTNNGTFVSYSSEQGLAHNSVYRIMEDSKQNLWFAMIGKSITCFDGKLMQSFSINQLAKEANSVRAILEENDGSIWFGTIGSGVFHFFPSKTNKIKDGVFLKYTTKQGLADNTINSIVKDHNGYVWFATNNGISRFDGKTFISYNSQHGMSDDVAYDIVEDCDSNLWIGTNLGLCCFTLSSASSTEIFQPSKIKQSNVKLAEFTPSFSHFNLKTGYPIKDLNTNAMFVSKIGFKTSLNQARVGKGVIWGGCGDDNLIYFTPPKYLHTKPVGAIILQNIKINNEPINWYNLLLDRKNQINWNVNLSNDIFNIKTYARNKDSATIAQQEIITYGKSLTAVQRKEFSSKYNDILFDSILPNYPIPQNLVLPYKHNNITIEFNAVKTDANQSVLYRYFLEGYDNNWNPITNKTTATFGNIREGTYTFKLQAKSDNEPWTDYVYYTFRVLPPWYRTWWAYFLYVVSSFSFLFIIYKIRTRSLIKDKEMLEQTVKERTFEIEKQKKEIERKNEKITDSISYAKHIQDSLLKKEESIQKYLPDFFVIYKPKDIVSGDFYWFSERENKFIIAAADCTGHGVPGAFMSMIGNMLLNEIVNDLNFTTPSIILDQLNQRLIESLNQTTSHSQTHDGMDITVCAIDLANNTIECAGAQSFIFISQNAQLEMIKLDSKSIGGSNLLKIKNGKKNFTNLTFPVTEDTYIYLLTDGYIDQFGGPNNKKIGSTYLKQIILNNIHLPMLNQKKIIEAEFDNWKGKNQQTDDVLLVGLKIKKQL